MSPARRFWSKVDTRADGECWRWLASVNGGGYGRTGIKGLPLRAHRAAWMLTRGPIPAGLIVRHKCDNPPCCNPAHLEPGTLRDNTRDMFARGRGRPGRLPGERCRLAKLTWQQVDEARFYYIKGSPISSPNGVGFLAEKFGVTRGGMVKAVRGDTWREVDRPSGPGAIPIPFPGSPSLGLVGCPTCGGGR